MCNQSHNIFIVCLFQLESKVYICTFGLLALVLVSQSFRTKGYKSGDLTKQEFILHKPGSYKPIFFQRYYGRILLLSASACCHWSLSSECLSLLDSSLLIRTPVVLDKVHPDDLIITWIIPAKALFPNQTIFTGTRISTYLLWRDSFLFIKVFGNVLVYWFPVLLTLLKFMLKKVYMLNKMLKEIGHAFQSFTHSKFLFVFP